ncbi:hypothetical protein, partial [Shewanella algae]|uniref:hypothetical protein n=1 Tax=Shewanella algae TaxID=38313 RepID=UPI00313ABC1D
LLRMPSKQHKLENLIKRLVLISGKGHTDMNGHFSSLAHNAQTYWRASAASESSEADCYAFSSTKTSKKCRNVWE